MGKNKLKKFAEMETLDCVFQYPFAVLKEQGGCPLRGHWNRDYFHNDNPIVVELGCGKGEYAVGLASTTPDKNFIGIDIKGARMWTGAKRVRDLNLGNCAFLRTGIELLESFFAPGEVAEIWITFPDPQMKKVNKRLTGTRFMELYRKVLVPGGLVHLKTDSPFLYTYTREMLRHNGITPAMDTADLYGGPLATVVPPIKTFYEQQWLDRGLSIKFLSWSLNPEPPLTEPDIEIEPDTYRSFGRGELQGF
ncbi:MAG: tRNA (guanosine(46)-N7)-methyltransferase TrmB [Duncaniella sp.]|nr:tRNA (guanosine(46)-N7)-methyltransferase TrmB [Duncaniella sp.]HBI59087.1 tRNA (guanosine(46)-N7)-methyltransferase TrmB [Porphyromonadaceae bacterium]